MSLSHGLTAKTLSSLWCTLPFSIKYPSSESAVVRSHCSAWLIFCCSIVMYSEASWNDLMTKAVNLLMGSEGLKLVGPGGGGVD